MREDAPAEDAPADPGDTDDTDDAGTSRGGSSLGRRIGRVAAASAVAVVLGQLISLAQTVALARLLSPTEVGLFAAGSVLTAFAGTFAEGGLRSGLIHREHALADASETVFRATLLAGFLMSLAALAAAPLVGLLFDDRTAGLVAAGMAGGVLLTALTNVPEALLQRQFSVLRRLVVGPGVATAFAVTSVSLAASGFGVWSLVIGSYVSTLTWVLILWGICDWRPGRGRPTLALYRELVGYGAPLAISEFFDHGMRSVRGLVTGGILGVQSLGLYRYGERIAQIPSGVIVEVGANALFPAYSRLAHDPERLRAAFLRALTLLVVVGAAMSAALVAVGQPMVVVVLGEEWREAGTVLVAMAGVGLGTALSTSGELLKGAGRTGLLNWITAIDVLLGVALLVLLAWTAGLLGVGLSISIASLVVSATTLAMARSVLEIPWTGVLRAVLPATAAAGLAGAAVYALEHLWLRSDERPLLEALGLLALDGVVFLAALLVLLRLLAPGASAVVAEVANPVLARLRRRGPTA